MFNFLKSLLGITLVALLGYGLYRVATQNANNSLKTLRVSPDSTATISGTVLENKKDCFAQSPGSKCFLKLRVSEKDVYVVYNTNDSAFCANENTAASGKNVRDGATVKVYGFYRKDGDLDTILTCPSAKYFIQEL
jgi:hypothetical protein